MFCADGWLRSIGMGDHSRRNHVLNSGATCFLPRAPVERVSFTRFQSTPVVWRTHASIENGFYYDIDLGDDVITDNDFAKIEAKMMELAGKGEAIQRTNISKADARISHRFRTDKASGIDDRRQNSGSV